MAGKKTLQKQEIKNILSQDWTKRRQKNKERAKKGSELTKKWKQSEKTLKELEKIKSEADLHNSGVRKRRSNYITTPDF